MLYNSIQLLFRYLDYLKKSKTRYRVHSPFVFSLVEQVLRKQPPFYVFNKIEKWRDELLENSDEINLTDLDIHSVIPATQSLKKEEVWDEIEILPLE